MKQRTRSAFLITGAAIALTLTACSNQTDTATPTASSPATTSTETKECAPTTGQQALQQTLDKIPPPFPGEPGADNQWSMSSATDTYDPCADLSWIVLQIDGATASSPHQILFFHEGTYAGLATDQSFGFAPAITRIDDDLVQVTFRWPLDGESNADASGTTTSTYGWNDNRLERRGELPPGV